MAKSDQENPKLPTPAQLEESRAERETQSFGFQDALKLAALGLAPMAPRMPEQAATTTTYFGAYPKGYSNRLGMKGTISFDMLRQIAWRSPVLSAIVSTRLHQRSRFARIANRSKRGEVGGRVVHRRQSDKDFKVPEGFDALCREAEQMIMRPWRVYWNEGVVHREIEPSFASFGSKFVEDTLVLNRPAIELGLDSLRIPRAFGAIDGANVLPTFAVLKWLTSLPENRTISRPDWHTTYQGYQQTLQRVSDKYKVHLTDSTEYIYVQNGKPAATFRHDEIIVAPLFPTSELRNNGYPRSLLERSIFIILAEIMAMTANSRYFEFGSMAETILAMKGNYDDTHVKDLTAIMQANMSGVNGMFRVPLVALPGGAQDLEVVQLKQNHKDMLFDVYIQKLTNLACAVFRMHPSEINEAARAGDNSGSLNQGSQVKQINMAQEQGLETLLEHEKREVLDPILQRIDPDLCWEWEYGQNEQEQINLTNSYATITTVNERRQMMGLDPLKPEEGGDVIDNQFIQAKNQAEQQAAQGGAGGPAPAGAAPPGAGGGGQGGQGAGKPPEQKDEGSGNEESPDDRIARLAALQG